MPKATVRANARAKANPHPDAAIFAIVDKLTSVGNRFGAASRLLDEAEARHKEIEPPRALIKTEEDARMRLFILGAAGEPYSRLEIEAIGAILRSFKDCATYGAYRRGRTILESWSTWTARKQAEEARSNYEAANRAQGIALEELSNIVAQLTLTPTLTVDGLLAKAHALGDFANVENLTELIKEQLDLYGSLDRETMALSLFSDMLSLKTRTAEEIRAA